MASTSAWQSCPPPRSPCATARAFPVATLTTTPHTAPSSTSRSWPPSNKNHHCQQLLHLYCQTQQLKSGHDGAVDFLSTSLPVCGRQEVKVYFYSYIYHELKLILLHNSTYVDLNQATLEQHLVKRQSLSLLRIIEVMSAAAPLCFTEISDIFKQMYMCK